MANTPHYSKEPYFVSGGGGAVEDGSITTEKFAPDAKAPFAGEADTVKSVNWADVQGKPATFAPTAHTHTIAQVDGLQTQLNAKLTASKAEAQADSAAEDVPGLVADFNSLLAKLRAAGIMK